MKIIKEQTFKLKTNNKKPIFLTKNIKELTCEGRLEVEFAGGGGATGGAAGGGGRLEWRCSWRWRPTGGGGGAGDGWRTKLGFGVCVLEVQVDWGRRCRSAMEVVDWGRRCRSDWGRRCRSIGKKILGF
ncbi:hypothetical protein HanIR_Chr17g0879781 [Helianthus annuus]|nr:hypothetical protein HanIR_Chr17g0879781 [Helianthus annuus]